MAKVTKFDKRSYDIGQQVKKCRLARGMTQQELADSIFSLPENKGKTRSEKQIGYIENGVRTLSNDYALLIARALNVRVEYLLLLDDCMTEQDRMDKIGKIGRTRHENIEHLIKLHGYETSVSDHPGFSCHLRFPPDIDETEAVKRVRNARPEQVIEIKSPSGDVHYMERSDYFHLLRDIDDFIEMRLSFLFRKQTDGLKEYW